jgi:hypothetical protein
LEYYQNEIDNRIKQSNENTSDEFLLFVENDMTRLKAKINSLNETKNRFQKEVDGFETFIPSQNYGHTNTKLINSHNLLVNLFSFFLLGLTISILYVITRYFIRLES